MTPSQQHTNTPDVHLAARAIDRGPDRNGGIDTGGAPVGRPGGGTFETFEPPGPIGTRWRQLGGETWGHPLNFPMDLPGGGQWVSFNTKTNRDYSKVIVQGRTGVFTMSRPIFEAWVNGGGLAVVGYPTSDTRSIGTSGSWQTFEHGEYVYSSTTGAHLVTGAIRARYDALGGSGWGFPTTDEGGTPDGRGWFNHFRDLASGDERSIYSTPATGTWEVLGPIRQAWSAAGWERGPMGYPTTQQFVTGGGVGRYQWFEHGMYVWHPQTGAHWITGDILTRYNSLGGSGWGYPTTDQIAAVNGGQLHHFRDVGTGEDRTIYWTASSGAMDVIGPMRAKWMELGGDRGYLGHPTSPLTIWIDGGTGARQQLFAGGRILQLADGTIGPDPVVLYRTINATGVRGEVRVSIPHAGRPRLTGYVRAVKQDSYDFTVNVLVTSPLNTGVLFHEHGEIHGDLESGAERYNFDQTGEYDIPAANFWDFQRATLQVDKKYDSHLTGMIGDFVEGLVTWIVGATVIATPGTALILLGGTAAATAIKGGSLSSGMRLVGGTLWLAGPFGTLVALAATAIAELAADDREIHDDEYALVSRVFGATLPAKNKIRIANGIGGENRPFTYPTPDRTVFLNVGKKYFDNTLPYGVEEGDYAYGQLLVHEMTHVWQYHNNAADISYIADAIWGAIRQDYEPGVVLDEDWDWFGIEEQARIVDAWFKKYYTGPGAVDASGNPRNGTVADNYGLNSSGATNDQAYAFIRDNIRRGRN